MNTLILSPAEPEWEKKAAIILKNGGLVAIPTETVYGLAANALDEKAVKSIYKAKGRPSDNPLIVHISEIDELYPLVKYVPQEALDLANKFWPGPLTIILPKTDIVPYVTSGNLDTVAVRMPSNEIARQVIKIAGVPLAAPSANISGLPSPTSFEHVFDDLNGRIDAIVDGGDCAVGIESTVITLATDVPTVLRPGGISVEELREVLGEVKIDDSVLCPMKEGVIAASPGMRYKHYSPKAEITVIKGNIDEFVNFADRNKTGGTAVLCFNGEEDRFDIPTVTFGNENDALSQAARLFHALRELDEIDAKMVFARCPNAEGVGLAVCNRLYRAAGFRIKNAVSVIGLTGKTGSGKSTVARYFAENGYDIIDCDAITKELYLPDSELLAQLAEVFGDDILNSDKSLNRKKLADRAFSSDENTKLLNSITHPAIFHKVIERIEDSKSRYNSCVIDAPLLFETGLNKYCDITVAVIADESVRIERIMKRDNITFEQAKLRMNTQKLSDDYYRQHADYCIENSGDENELKSKLHF
ncbi:MAG TPA: threonylcarbamoyl-AMP synthase [Clostridiales bacterium]|nr:threonylcarbamoyl-AMP synthase [Clostridiales bacterium]